MNTLLRILLLRDVPFWTATAGRRWARRVAGVLYVYFGVVAALLLLENRLLFAGATFNTHWREPPEDMQEVEIPVAGGGHVVGWFTAPPGWEPSRGAVLFAHGNGSNLSTRTRLLRLWRQHLGRAVLGYDYPGYGKSPGATTEAGCYAAGDGAYDWLVQEKKVPAGEIVLVGESLVGGIVLDQAVRRENRMVITLAAFTSFPDMAQLKFPWVPARYFVRNRFDNLAKIPHVRGPVFISHGTADALTPFAHGERLAAAAVEPKRFQPLEGLPHRHPDQPEFWDAVRAFLGATGRR
ncbi:MAG: alpha/beta hydrolase [Gemmataceae bacterium]